MLNLRKWTYRGNRLAAPHTILRRLIALPCVHTARVALYLATWLGWGAADARRIWRDTQ